MSARAKTALSGASVLVASAVCALGCRTPATQLDLRLDTACRRAGQSLELTFFDADDVAITGLDPSLTRIADVSWPHLQTLAPRDQDARRASWHVRATLREGATTLVEDDLRGTYALGERATQTWTLADPSCATSDAGGIDAGAIDAAADIDAGVPPDAAPLPGCDPRTYARETEQLELLYVFDVGSGDSVPNTAPGGVSSLVLAGQPGSFDWREGGTCARVGGTPRPFVGDGVAIHDALSHCASSGSITIEAWLTVDTEPAAGARQEVFTHGVQGTGMRGGFSLGIAPGELVASTNGCDGQGRPFYRFPRPPGLVHVVYTQQPIALDAAMGDFDAGTTPTETWGFEHAYVDGTSATLSVSPRSDEASAGCVPSVAGLRRFGVSFPEADVVHLGGAAPWGAFDGCYHLLAVYCRPLTLTEARNNYCAGPPRR